MRLSTLLALVALTFWSAVSSQGAAGSGPQSGGSSGGSGVETIVATRANSGIRNDSTVKTDSWLAQTNMMARQIHYATVNARNLRAGFGNFANEWGGSNNITVTASLEDTNGTIYPLFFGGSRTVVIVPNGYVESDPSGFSVTKTMPFWSRTYVQMGTTGFVMTAGALLTGGGTTNTDFTLGGTVQPLSTFAYTPFTIRGLTDTRDVEVAGFGDSIINSVGDGTDRDNSWFTRSLGTNYGWHVSHIVLGQGSEQMTTAVFTNRLKLARGASHAVTAYGVNDILNGKTLTQIQTAMTNFWTTLNRNGMAVMQTTITPAVTTNVGGTLAVTNQTPSAGESVRVALNNWIRTTPAPLSGYIELADIVETSRDSGRWTPIMTLEGIHPSTTGHVALATAISSNTFRLTTSASALASVVVADSPLVVTATSVFTDNRALVGDGATRLAKTSPVTIATDGSITGVADLTASGTVSAAHLALAATDTAFINNLTEDASPASGDFIVSYDVSAGLLKKVQRANFDSGGGGGGTTADFKTLTNSGPSGAVLFSGNVAGGNNGQPTNNSGNFAFNPSTFKLTIGATDNGSVDVYGAASAQNLNPLTSLPPNIIGQAAAWDISRVRYQQIDSVSNAPMTVGNALHINGTNRVWRYTASTNASLILTNLLLDTPVELEVYPSSGSAGWALTFNLPAAAWGSNGVPAFSTNLGMTRVFVEKVSSTQTNAWKATEPILQLRADANCLAFVTNGGTGIVIVTNVCDGTSYAILSATNANAVRLQVANSNAFFVTNILGVVEKAVASVIELNANDANEFVISNRVTAATTLVVTNTAPGQEISITIVGEASGGTSRVITVIPQLGHLVADLDTFGTALATSTSFTLTNGNAAEINAKINKVRGTNIFTKVSRQYAF